MAVILAYELTREKAELLKQLGQKTKAEIKLVPVSSYGETLGYLAGIFGFRRNGKGGAAFGQEMLVFSGMDEDSLDQFLEEWKQGGLPAPGLKAVITPHNIFWNSTQLFEELKKEHAAMNRQQPR